MELKPPSAQLKRDMPTCRPARCAAAREAAGPRPAGSCMAMPGPWRCGPSMLLAAIQTEAALERSASTTTCANAGRPGSPTTSCAPAIRTRATRDAAGRPAAARWYAARACRTCARSGRGCDRCGDGSRRHPGPCRARRAWRGRHRCLLAGSGSPVQGGSAGLRVTAGGLARRRSGACARPTRRGTAARSSAARCERPSRGGPAEWTCGEIDRPGYRHIDRRPGGSSLVTLGYRRPRELRRRCEDRRRVERAGRRSGVRPPAQTPRQRRGTCCTCPDRAGASRACRRRS